MEDPNEKNDTMLHKQTNAELFEKSAEIKKKNNIVQEKLRDLKKQADELLKIGSDSKTGKL